jgi:hypothetical protein
MCVVYGAGHTDAGTADGREASVVEASDGRLGC